MAGIPGQGMGPRCGKPMRVHVLNRFRLLVTGPRCGRAAGHDGWCLTQEAYDRELARTRARRRREG